MGQAKSRYLKLFTYSLELLHGNLLSRILHKLTLSYHISCIRGGVRWGNAIPLTPQTWLNLPFRLLPCIPCYGIHSIHTYGIISSYAHISYLVCSVSYPTSHISYLGKSLSANEFLLDSYFNHLYIPYLPYPTIPYHTIPYIPSYYDGMYGMVW